MKTTSEQLISDLIERTRYNINEVKKMNDLPLQDLNWKPAPDRWSVLECIEHLNLYGDYYLPEIESCIRTSRTMPDDEFEAGLLGNYFANAMLPKEKMKTMKTFKNKNPNGSSLTKKTLTRFLEQQERMLKHLDRSRRISLNRTKTSVSISRFIKLKLGDTFRVVIYHNQRHIVQAQNVLKEKASVKVAA